MPRRLRRVMLHMHKVRRRKGQIAGLLALLPLVAAANTVHAQAPTASGQVAAATSAQDTVPAASVPSAPSTQLEQLQTDGLKALRANQPQQALGLFQQMLAVDPQSAAANLLAATAELSLYQTADGLRYALRAQALEPGNWKVHTTLVTAYAMAGDVAHRDAESAILLKDHNDPALPEARDTNGYLLDLFQVGRYKVEAVEYFHAMGRYNTYYRFLIRNAAGVHVWTIEINSDSLNQSSWAMAYPKQAAQGQRQFQIESSAGDDHVEYRTFSGAPSYDYIKPQIVKILESQKAPFPGETAPK